MLNMTALIRSSTSQLLSTLHVHLIIKTTTTLQLTLITPWVGTNI